MSTSSSAEQVLQLSHSIDLESMKLNIKYLSIGLGVITGIILSLTLLKRDGGNRSTEIGPGETVIAFHTALAEGNIALAKSLCITLSMEEYINAYSDALDAKAKKDSCNLAFFHPFSCIYSIKCKSCISFPFYLVDDDFCI